jgi:hypothetical protein
VRPVKRCNFPLTIPAKAQRVVNVEGRLQTGPYTGQDGMEKLATEVILEKLVFLDSMPKDVK